MWHIASERSCRVLKECFVNLAMVVSWCYWPDDGVWGKEVIWNREFHPRRDVLSPRQVITTKPVVPCNHLIWGREWLKIQNPSSFGVLQGRRNAQSEHIDKFEDGMVEFRVACSLFIGRRPSVLALEDFLPEKEAHLKTGIVLKTLRL